MGCQSATYTNEVAKRARQPHLVRSNFVPQRFSTQVGGPVLHSFAQIPVVSPAERGLTPARIQPHDDGGMLQRNCAAHDPHELSTALMQRTMRKPVQQSLPHSQRFWGTPSAWSSDALPFFDLRTSEEGVATTGGQQPELPHAYGWAECKFPGGASVTITTSGCNKPCTELHESVHLKDIKPCCEQANVEYLFAGGDAQKQQQVRTSWSRWANSTRAALECRAYAASIPCMERAKIVKKCDREQKSPDEKECCGELELALADDRAGARDYNCESASKELPPCPFGPSGP